MKNLRNEIQELIDSGLQITDLHNTANLFYDGNLSYHTVYRYVKGIHTNISYNALVAISKGLNQIKEELLADEYL